MNILICDDIRSEAVKIERLFNESDFDIKSVNFQNGYDALDYIQSGAVVDCCFLDIVMPEISGVALAEELRASGYTGEIVFLTTSNDYAAESYTVNTFSYILKPLNPAKVRDILKLLENARQKSDAKGILIKVAKVARFILFRDISYVEVIKHYVYFSLIDEEEIEIYATFSEFASQLLNDSRFAQCHRSYIVNMSEIASIDDKEIIMRGGKRLPVSKSYLDVKKKFTKWMIGASGK